MEAKEESLGTDLATMFLARFFHPARTAKLRSEINNFSQYEKESLYEAWEHYKDMLRKCPHHGMPKWLVSQTFYNGLGASNRTLIDAAEGGAFNMKTEQEAYNLIEQIAMNNYQWPTERLVQRRALAAVNEMSKISSQLQNQNQVLSQLVQVLTKNHVPVNAVQSVVCELCGGAYSSV